MASRGLFALIIISFGLSRKCALAMDMAENRLRDLNQELANLKEQFVEDTNSIFYDRLRARSDINHPLMVLSAHIAELQATLYAFQRRGLFVAQEIIQKYFIDNSKRLSKIFISNYFLVDMIVQRCIEHSIQDGLYEIEKPRKLIYLLLRRYEDEPGVLELAREYLQNIVILSVKGNFVQTDFIESFEGYKQAVSLMFSSRLASATLKALDDMIDDAWDSLNENNLLGKYVDPKLVTDIQTAKRKTAGKIDEINPESIETIKMSTVLLYEEKIAEELHGLALSQRYVDLKQADLDEQFTTNIKGIFYEHQLLAEIDENFPLMDLSIKITECEGLMYVNERRMLNIIHQIIDQCAIAFASNSESNFDPIDIIAQHLIKYSLENGLVAIEERRKEIYLLLQRYDRRMVFKELAHKYARFIQDRKVKIVDAEIYIRDLWSDYQVDVANQLSAEQVSNVMSIVGQIVETAVELWRKEAEDLGQSALLQKYLEPRVLQDLEYAKQEALGKAPQVDADEIRSVNIVDVMVYDDKLDTELSDSQRLAAYVSDIDYKIDDLEDRFHKTTAEIFHQIQSEVREQENPHLVALSALMAESELMMHVYERRMLSTLKCIMNQYSKAFSRIIAVNKGPINIIALRLMKYALENAITRAADSMKKIYLLTRERENMAGVREMAKNYFKLIKIREQRITKSDELIAIYTRKVTLSLSPSKLSFALQAIESIIKRGVSTWRRLTEESDKTGQFEVYIDPKLLGDIEAAKQSSQQVFDEIDQLDPGLVDMSEVHRYRRQLLNSD